MDFRPAKLSPASRLGPADSNTTLMTNITVMTETRRAVAWSTSMGPVPVPRPQW